MIFSRQLEYPKASLIHGLLTGPSAKPSSQSKSISVDYVHDIVVLSWGESREFDTVVLDQPLRDQDIKGLRTADGSDGKSDLEPEDIIYLAFKTCISSLREMGRPHPL